LKASFILQRLDSRWRPSGLGVKLKGLMCSTDHYALESSLNYINIILVVLVLEIV